MIEEEEMRLVLRSKKLTAVFTEGEIEPTKAEEPEEIYISVNEKELSNE